MTPTTNTSDRESSFQTAIQRAEVAAQGLTVESDAQFESAGAMLKEVASGVAAAEEFFRPDIKAANDLHKSLLAKLNGFVGPWGRIREIIEGKMRAYRAEQQAARAAAERALAAESDRLRREAEKEAHDLALRGHVAQAKQVQARAESQMMRPVLPAAAPKVEGIKNRDAWTAQCDDLPALIIQVGMYLVDEGKGIPPEKRRGFPLYHDVVIQGRMETLSVLGASDKVLRYKAAAMKTEFNVPGCSASSEEKFAVSKGGR